MIVALSGTPGTGKTSVSNLLKEKEYAVISINEVAFENNFVVGIDEKRDSKIIDIDKVNDYIKEHYKTTDITIIEGHSSHLLKDVDKVIILRCHPTELKKRLKSKGWKNDKIKENVEAETIDVILCEATEVHPANHLFEIDTTHKKIESIASSIIEILNNSFEPRTKYNIGTIDWSEEILKEF